MNALFIILTLNAGGTIYVSPTEITTVADSRCDHWEGHMNLFSNDSHLVKEECTEVALKNGKFIYVKERALDIISKQKTCK